MRRAPQQGPAPLLTARSERRLPWASLALVVAERHAFEGDAAGDPPHRHRARRVAHLGLGVEQVEGDLEAQGRTLADEGTTEEKAREEYRAIAERRVRLGLVLAEIGEKNSITVTDEEVRRAIAERARQVPGREQEVWEYYQKNPNAVATIRAPIFEEKVVDFLVELATVTEKQVSREELAKDDEDTKGAG